MSDFLRIASFFLRNLRGLFPLALGVNAMEGIRPLIDGGNGCPKVSLVGVDATLLLRNGGDMLLRLILILAIGDDGVVVAISDDDHVKQGRVVLGGGFHVSKYGHVGLNCKKNF